MNFYWPRVAQNVTDYCKSCETCQRTGKSGDKRKAPLQPLPIIDQPSERVGTDIVGPLRHKTRRGKKYILTLVDFGPRYPEAIALTCTEAPIVAEALTQIFFKLGFPSEILTDRGGNFLAEVMKCLWGCCGAKHFKTTAYHPRTNGLVERFNGTLKAQLQLEILGSSSNTYRCKASNDVKLLCNSSENCYRGRLRVPNDGLSLQIADLRLEDAGSYTAKVITDKREFNRFFTLRLYECLPQPTIDCGAQSCVNGLCNTTLSCTIPNRGSNVTYNWSAADPQAPSTTTQGSSVIISHPDLPVNVKCTVHNPVSSSSTMSTCASALCTVNVKCTVHNPVSSSSTVTACASALCTVPAQPPSHSSSLSYYQAKGLVLLLVLGVLIIGTMEEHIMAGKQLKQN
ncbi:hypothetical protein Y1Q_0022615 [Alligator mississippiensis]|uniref:Gypsy retrotransposon integrase-like protein 1 n=1 Tax=Alligator mississippiensis TaxID=8496 RepID=A0A151N7U0_ALLMI|nr:hypothetical protein Y1Q_0022615 [Alligator mississippiensis]